MQLVWAILHSLFAYFKSFRAVYFINLTQWRILKEWWIVWQYCILQPSHNNHFGYSNRENVITMLMQSNCVCVTHLVEKTLCRWIECKKRFLFIVYYTARLSLCYMLCSVLPIPISHFYVYFERVDDTFVLKTTFTFWMLCLLTTSAGSRLTFYSYCSGLCLVLFLVLLAFA